MAVAHSKRLVVERPFGIELENAKPQPAVQGPLPRNEQKIELSSKLIEKLFLAKQQTKFLAKLFFERLIETLRRKGQTMNL